MSFGLFMRVLVALASFLSVFLELLSALVDCSQVFLDSPLLLLLLGLERTSWFMENLAFAFHLRFFNGSRFKFLRLFGVRLLPEPVFVHWVNLVSGGDVVQHINRFLMLFHHWCSWVAHFNIWLLEHKLVWLFVNGWGRVSWGIPRNGFFHLIMLLSFHLKLLLFKFSSFLVLLLESFFFEKLSFEACGNLSAIDFMTLATVLSGLKSYELWSFLFRTFLDELSGFLSGPPASTFLLPALPISGASASLSKHRGRGLARLSAKLFNLENRVVFATSVMVRPFHVPVVVSFLGKGSAFFNPHVVFTLCDLVVSLDFLKLLLFGTSVDISELLFAILCLFVSHLPLPLDLSHLVLSLVSLAL